VKGKFIDASRQWSCFGLRPKVSDDRRSFYVVEVRGKQNILGFWKLSDDKRDPAMERNVPLAPIQEGRWYTLRWEMIGDRIAVDLDGRRVLELTDPNPIPSGRTAISASYGTVQIDDFRQEAVDSDYRFAEPKAPPPTPYDPGSALPSSTARGEEDAHYWYLVGPMVRVAVHRQTGMIGGIFRAVDGRPLVRRSLTLYHLQTRASDVSADSYGDRIEKVVQRSPSEVRIDCTNPGMPGIAIRKHYCLAPGDGRLTENVTLVNRTDRPDVFLTLAVRAVVDEGFRREAIYTGGSYFGPLVPAASIRQRVLTDPFKTPWLRGITNGRPSWILVLNHALDQHYAVYRYRVNGQYVLPWNSIWTEPANNLYHTPVGWEMGVVTLHLVPGEERSAELDHVLFRGSRLDFYDHYAKQPEVAAMIARAQPRPSWLSEIKSPIDLVDDYHLSFTEDGVLVKLDQPFGVWGEMPTSGLVRTQGGITRWPVQRVREQLRRFQDESPRVKAGFYTWAWSVHHKSAVAGEHPKWFIARDRDGKIRNAYPLALSFLRCLSAPGCLEATIRNYHDLVRYYGQDFQYLDNDGTGVQIIDWEHLRIDQDYDWQRLHEGILAAARARSPETATFFNNRVLPQGDISFAEFMPEEIQNADWRRPANEMLPLKVFQKRDPERVIALLYWRPASCPGYPNYCVGLGLLPWSDQLAHLPFINAAWETRRLEIVDAGLAPDWQRDLETNVEAYTLRQGGAAFVFLVGHDPVPVEAEIAFDTRPMGMEPGKPYFAWQFELADCRALEGRLTEKEQRAAYRASNWADEIAVSGTLLEYRAELPVRFSRTLTARPQRLRMLMLTHSPALVWSINHQRRNFWVPSVRKIDLGGRLDGSECRVDCACGEESAELAVFVPQGQTIKRVTLDDQPTAWTPEFAGGAWFAKVGVARGNHRLAVRYGAAEPPPKTATIVTAERVQAGETVEMEITGSGASGVLSVCREDTVVANLPALAGERRLRLALPKTARPGLYEVSFVPLGAAGADTPARLEVLPGDWKPAARREPLRGSPAVKVWDVGRQIGGLHVLRASTDTFDHQGGVQIAELDTDRLAFRCGLDGQSQSPWGYGFCGIEIDGIQTIRVELENNFWQPHRDGFELGDRYLDSFAGILLDYHTPSGYAHRVALGLGVLDKTRPVSTPHWGKSARPDACIELSRTILEKQRDELTVDLTRYAPPNWDGRVWVSVGVDTVYRGLQLQGRFAAGNPAQ